ncbi:MAG: ABC transporter ATP-binding protein [Nitrosomonas sp.]|nr:ABC transporter ATP-binding protein [Nitrosomonas sp.]
MNKLLQLDNIRFAYTGQIIIDELSFALQQGEIGCLLGPSGCGKTSVLRCIAGFESIIDGDILLNGICVSRSNYILPPEQRQVGMVFQEYALFPHLNVAANIGFGLHRSNHAEKTQRVNELLQITGLTDVANQYPHELSGGQQQRVALARALAPRPDLLLLDEPFSNLDVGLRERLGQEVRSLLKQLGITAILVTHDQTEAFAVADKIGVMHAGKMMQWSSAYDLYHRPANRFVASFIGQGVLLPGRIHSSGKVDIIAGTLTENIWLSCQPDCKINRTTGLVDVLIRPDDIVHDDHSQLRAIVLNKTFRGADILYTLQLAEGATVLSLIPSHHDHAIGEKIGIRLEADHVVVFERSSAEDRSCAG